MTDRELIRRSKAGNKDALNLIIHKYYDDIYKFCLYLTANELDSYDISQEVFLRFIKYIDTYTYKNVKGYLLIIARNLCRDYFRRIGAESNLQLSENVMCDGDEIKNTELKLFIDTLLKQLPIEQREVIILRCKEEMRFKDIANILGCSLSTAKSRYRLGIERLKKVMVDYEKK